MSENLCPCCHRPLPSVYAEAIRDAGLSAQEKRLFLAVAGGAGEIVKFSTIVSDIWGADINGGPIDPRTHIHVVASRANRKIASSGYRLVSVHSQGYRLETIIPEVAA